MEKLTTILAVLEESGTAGIVLHKATALARCFDAHLELLIVEPLLAADVLTQYSSLGCTGMTVRAASRAGRRLDAVILDDVRGRVPDLVVKFRCGRHPLRRYALADSDWRLSQQCPVPVMLVEGKAWSSPMRFAATVDVSDAARLEVARAVLHTAGFLTLGSRGFLDVLYTERELHDETLRMARAVKLAQLVREFHVGCERLQMFDGVPEKKLLPLISAREYDVLLLGAVSQRSRLSEMICPLSSRLVEATPGDVVLVNPNPAWPEVARTGIASVG